jgi:hypothetical protein
MINWNIVTRPNTNIEFFEFTEEDRAYFQNFIDSGKMYSTEETLSQDGLSKIFKMIWYINNSQEAINMQNILGAEQYLQDLAIRSTLYNIENGIQRSTTFYETRDDDGNVLFSGDLTTDALFGNSN